MDTFLARTGRLHDRRPVWRTTFLVFACLLLTGPAAATSIEQVSFARMAHEADFIVQGSVSGQRTELRDGTPWTCIAIDVSKTLKGSPGDQKPELCFLGGNLADGSFVVSGTVIPKTGQEGIFFCYDGARNMMNPLVGWTQGAFYVGRDARTGTEFVTTIDGTPVVEIDAGTRPVADGIAPQAAAGVVLGEPDKSEMGMSPEQFVTSLHKALLEPQ